MSAAKELIMEVTMGLVTTKMTYKTAMESDSHYLHAAAERKCNAEELREMPPAMVQNSVLNASIC